MYEYWGCNMGIKLYFLNSHIDYFPKNRGALNEERDERFHRDIKEMETRLSKSTGCRLVDSR